MAAQTEEAAELAAPISEHEPEDRARVVLEPEPVEEPQRPIPLLDDDIESAPAAKLPRHEWKVRLAVLLLAGLLFLPNLGSFGLWDPWETHYGAVTTDMVETHDWVGPWWGYKEQIGTEPKQGKPFMSKPVFIFWAEAAMCRLVGRGEWAVRLPMALLAMFAVLMIYITMTRLWSRRAALIGAGVVATAPQFFMISRQAQTDMPFVATMIIALTFLMLALFAPRRRLSNRAFWGWAAATLGLVLLNTLPQYAIIGMDLDLDPPDSVRGGALTRWNLVHQGVYHVALYLAVLVPVLVWFALSLLRDIKQNKGLDDALKDRWLRRFCLVAFYVFVAQSTYAKGLLGFALPGFFILVWLAISRNWRVLARVELIRGILIALCVGVPWYAAMFARFGQTFWQRFFIHDHFNRLGAGVHQIDTGEFEHFIKWLGIGMFPWAVLVPFVIIWLVRHNPRDQTPAGQGKLFLSVWFVVAFGFFTLSSTKFHHYIFPALPAIGMLTALFIDRLLVDRGWLPRLAVVVGAVMFAALAWDLHEDPQHLRNLMTYKYDRPLPEHLPIAADEPVAKASATTWEEGVFWRHTSDTQRAILTTEFFRYETWITFIAILGFIALGLFFVAKTRMAGLVALGVTATALCLWSLNYYMPSLSPHWSQKYLFDSYYDSCTLVENPPEVEDAYTPLLAHVGLEGFARYLRYDNKRVCDEDVIPWLITWRGETYYSYNELQPITKEQPQFMPYLEERNHGRTFYALMERGKKSGFESKLNSYSTKLKRKGTTGWAEIDSWDVEIMCDESLFFQMVRATPIRAGAGEG